MGRVVVPGQELPQGLEVGSKGSGKTRLIAVEIQQIDIQVTYRTCDLLHPGKTRLVILYKIGRKNILDLGKRRPGASCSHPQIV